MTEVKTPGFKVIRFKEGETIPFGSRFLKQETVCTKNEPDYDCDCHPLQSCYCRIKEFTKYFYYEVPSSR